MTIAIDRRFTLIAVGAALAAAGAGYLLGHRNGTHISVPVPQQARAHARYQCPMHPGIISDQPGNCPICGMKLQRVDSGAGQPSGSGPRRILYYRNPMHPDVTSPVPAKDDMGMDYTPVYSDEGQGGGNVVVDGHASFTIPLERQQLIGVRTAKARVRTLSAEVRAVGRVAYDPELYNAIEEYKQAVAGEAQIKDSPLPDARQGARSLARSAAMRLRLLGLSQDQIGQLAGGGSDPINLLLPDKTAWIYAEVYEYEVDLIKQGQAMTVTAPSLPGRTYRGKVVAVDPVVNAQTRTARLRGLIETPSESLRPETFVNVTVAVAFGERLSVPEDAVIDTGERQLVFIKKGEGRFEPREVKLGRQAKGYFEVLSGLEGGEDVVTGANFLIDSESRFKAAVSAFGDVKR